MRDRYKFLTLVLISLCLYLSSLSSGYFVVDDLPLVEKIRSYPYKRFTDIFSFYSGTYYRALTGLSFRIDAWLWDLKPSFMHLVNILIHAVNASLVFIIARRMGTQRADQNHIIPLLAAIVFIVHPINTESINWISGRSDPLATVFALIATYLLVVALQNQRQWPVWFAALALLAGGLAKETALALIPGFILTLLFLKPDRSDLLPAEPGKTWRLFTCLPLVAAGLSYVYLRSSAFTKTDLGTTMIVETVASDDSLWSKLNTLVTAFGFYLKKLVIPWPQSFAIETVDPLYFWFGLCALFLITILLLRRNTHAALMMLIVLPILPALIVALVKFAFLPAYAERYLYMSSAFLAISLSLLAPGRAHISKGILFILIITYLPATIHRNLLWTDHLKLLETLNVQQLEHPPLWNAYCIVLADREQYSKARHEFNQLISKFPDDQTAYSNLARMELFIDDPDAARNVLEPFISGEIVAEYKTLLTLVKTNQALMEQTENPERRQQLYEENLNSWQKLYDLTQNTGHLLDAAESALANEDNETAKRLVQKIIDHGYVNKKVKKAVDKIRAALQLKDQ